MAKILLLLAISVLCLGYWYLCVFKKDKVLWVVTNPMNGNTYSDLLPLHSWISGLIGITALIVLIAKLLP